MKIEWVDPKVIRRYKHLWLFVLAVIATAAFPVAAKAHHSPVELALKDAGSYWHTESPCQTVTFEVLSIGGRASCPIEINQSVEQDWPELCKIITHEVGHLVLGANYFAATNPSDPAHSLDPNNLMYAAWEPVYPSTCFPASFRTPHGFIRWTVNHGHLMTTGREGPTIEHVELATLVRVT